MKKRSLPLLAWMCTAMVAACGDALLEPSLAEVALQPAEAALFAVPPDDTVQLTIVAYDQWGRPLADPDPGAATYSSSAPSIAEVSSSGLVRAVAPGTAEITATLTRGDRTTTGSMTVMVGWTDVSGVYDLSATENDLTGRGFTGVLTFLHDRGYVPGIGGAFRDLRVTGPDGTEDIAVPHGAISSSFDSEGRLVVGLGHNFSLQPGRDMLAPLIEGTFAAEGFVSGWFTASRREREGSGPVPATIQWYAYAWHPAALDVMAGDTVIWQLLDNTGDPAPTVIWFDGESDETITLVDGLARRVFPMPGEYWYCSSYCWDYGYGVVRVAPVGEP